MFYLHFTNSNFIGIFSHFNFNIKTNLCHILASSRTKTRWTHVWSIGVLIFILRETQMSTQVIWKYFKKNLAYGRHQLSRPMRIVGPIQICRGCLIYLFKKKWYRGGGRGAKKTGKKIFKFVLVLLSTSVEKVGVSTIVKRHGPYNKPGSHLLHKRTLGTWCSLTHMQKP